MTRLTFIDKKNLIFTVLIKFINSHEVFYDVIKWIKLNRPSPKIYKNKSLKMKKRQNRVEHFSCSARIK